MTINEQQEITGVHARVIITSLTVLLQRQHLASLLAAAEKLSVVRTRHAARTPGSENEIHPSQVQHLP
jgi:hypothetical protein